MRPETQGKKLHTPRPTQTQAYGFLCAKEMCGHTAVEERGINVDAKNAMGVITGLVFHDRTAICRPGAANDDNGRTLKDTPTRTWNA